jgi:polyisoprenoid-binding protein YceI
MTISSGRATVIITALGLAATSPLRAGEPLTTRVSPAVAMAPVGSVIAMLHGHRVSVPGATEQLMTTATTTTTTYNFDKAHSEVTFQVRHLLTKVRGRFSDFDGTVEYHEKDPEHSVVNVTIRTASIDTNERDRDAHLRSLDFFDVEKFPTLTFHSQAIRRRTDTEFDLIGQLTIHGVTRSVTFRVTHLGKAKDPWGNERIAFEADATINRKDFGLTWNAALETGGFLVGDEVKVSLSVQAVAARG